MAREGKGKVVSMGRARTRCITVPAMVAGDTSFPFKDEEVVMVTIDGDRLVVTRERR